MKFIALLAVPILHFVILLPIILLTRKGRSSRYLLLLLNLFYLLVAESLITGGLNFTLFDDQEWNWTGKLACFSFAVFLLAKGHPLTHAESGWTMQVHKGSLRPILAVTFALLILRSFIKIRFQQWHGMQAETLAFQATMPGLAEELIYRGLLLGLLNKLYPVKRNDNTSILTWPMLITALWFGMAHGLRLDEDLHLEFNFQSLCMTFGLGLVFGWLRQKSGSLWPSIVFHNLWNVVVLS